MSFLGVAPARAEAGRGAGGRLKRMTPDPERARKNIEPIRCPILILVGTDDGLHPVDRSLHDLLEKAASRSAWRSTRRAITTSAWARRVTPAARNRCSTSRSMRSRSRSSSSASPRACRPARLDIRPLPAIDAYVAAQVRDQGYPGLSLAILRDGKVVLAKGYGKRSIEDGAPVEPETMFAIGSVTKQFTCACILLLAEEGKLSVDDKVAKYYPGSDGAEDITLYDLMTHTSGYPDYYPLDFVDRRMVKPIAEDACWRSTPGPSSTSSPACGARTAIPATCFWAGSSRRSAASRSAGFSRSGCSSRWA